MTAAGLALAAAVVLPAGPALAAPYSHPEQPTLRIAAVDAGLSAEKAGGLQGRLAGGMDAQARQLAEGIARADADIVVLTGMDADQDAVQVFSDEYLQDPGLSGREAGKYPYSYAAVGVKARQSGADLNGDGIVGGAADAWGQAAFDEQSSIVVLSKLPIGTGEITAVSQLKWSQVPGNELAASGLSGALAASAPVMDTGLWDIPVQVGNEQVHLLATQTGAEQPAAYSFAAQREHDQLQVIDDYIAGADYLHDDAGQPLAGLAGQNYVTAGQLGDGGSEIEPAAQLRVLGQGRVPLKGGQELEDFSFDEPQRTPLVWTDVSVRG